MELSILNIFDRLDRQHERVVIQVSEDCNCWPYILIRNNGVRREESKVFIFPNMEVEKGDIITIYTKAGYPQRRKNTNERTEHILYWGEKESIWNMKNSNALLVKIEDYQTL